QGVLGWIDLDDALHPAAARVIAFLTARQVKTMVASGDRQGRVEAVAAETQVDQALGDLLPEQKWAVLRRFQDEGQTVLAVGDGVNDSALLGAADVSVALGDGADLAKSGADVVLAGHQLDKIRTAWALGLKVRRTIRQNLAWAIGYNLIAVPLAAVGWIGPGLAALGMSLSSLVVILNAARLAKSPSNRGAIERHPEPLGEPNVVTPT
ncbi:MAG: HAD-IC family P-type ATPase, partial [Pseudomonadota bacterium]